MMNENAENVEAWPRDGAYLTIKAGKERFVVDIRWVQEIVGFHKLTCPRKGIHTPLDAITLRGKDVPAMDMRLLCRGRISNTPQTSIIILRNHGTSIATGKAALVADDVGMVISLKMDDVSKYTVQMPCSDMTDYVDGTADIDHVPHYLINIGQVFNQFSHVPVAGSVPLKKRNVHKKIA